jgi:hypothetical protein
MTDTKMSGTTKTGLHLAKHSRKPKVGEIVFNIDAGKMELVEPKALTFFKATVTNLPTPPSPTPLMKSMGQFLGLL